jgi:hypothetical protein
MPGVDGAPPSPREGEDGGRGGRSLRTGLHGSLTRVAERLVEESREGFGLFTSFLGGFGGCGSCRARSVPTPEPHPQQEHAEPQQCQELEVVKEPIGSHSVPFL